MIMRLRQPKGARHDQTLEGFPKRIHRSPASEVPLQITGIIAQNIRFCRDLRAVLPMRASRLCLQSGSPPSLGRATGHGSCYRRGVRSIEEGVCSAPLPASGRWALEWHQR